MNDEQIKELRETAYCLAVGNLNPQDVEDYMAIASACARMESRRALQDTVAETAEPEEFTFESLTKDGHTVSRYVTSDWDDGKLLEKASNALSAELEIRIVDQDGVNVAEQWVREHLGAEYVD